MKIYFDQALLVIIVIVTLYVEHLKLLNTRILCSSRALERLLPNLSLHIKLSGLWYVEHDQTP